MPKEIKPSPDKLIVKIFFADKEEKTISEGGLITSHTLQPTLDACQIGQVISVGKDINYIKEKEFVLFNWAVDSDDTYFLQRDDTGEYRYVTERQVFGTVKTNKKTKMSHLQPKKNYVVAEAIGNDFNLTKSMFQIPVLGMNPMDKSAREMGIVTGDFIVCLPYSAVPITVKRKTFYFIHIDDIIFVNKEKYRLAINRKHVSEQLRIASRQVKTMLN